MGAQFDTSEKANEIRKVDRRLSVRDLGRVEE